MKKNPLCIYVDNVEVYFNDYFFTGILDRPARKHIHPSFELICVSDENPRFIINPPLKEHYSVDSKPENMCSFLFSFRKIDKKDVCCCLNSIKEERVVLDTFQGAEIIKKIKNLILDNGYGAFEEVKAQLKILFIELSRAIFSSVKNSENLVDLNKERVARMEDFFNINIQNPNCTKENLADELGVCVRQLSRIIKNVYGTSFSNVLLSSKMTLAEAMRLEKKPLKEILYKTGYSTEISFKRAYKKYYQIPFKKV